MSCDHFAQHLTVLFQICITTCLSHVEMKSAVLRTDPNLGKTYIFWVIFKTDSLFHYRFLKDFFLLYNYNCKV